MSAHNEKHYLKDLCLFNSYVFFSYPLNLFRVDNIVFFFK